MPLTPRSWVQITASSAKFTWLARHRKSEILSNNGDACLLWMGRFILGTKKQSLFRCTCSLLDYVTTASDIWHQVFLRDGAIQRGDGPNERRRMEPWGSPGEILKIMLCETAFRALWRQHDMKTDSQKRTLKRGYFPHLLNFKMIIFFVAETVLRMHFTVLENTVTFQREQK